MMVYKSGGSLLQTILFIVILIAMLVAGFYLFIALLPFILILGIYLWYKMRKNMKQFQEQMNAQGATTQNPYQARTVRYIYTTNNTQPTGANSQEQASQNSSIGHDEQRNNDNAVIYDISPEDYTVEEKK